MKKQAVYRLLPHLLLRAPFYSFAVYDLKRMPQVMGDLHFRNALYLASPALYEMLRRKDFNWDECLERERHTLRKYYNRMAFRPTPFGSFATFTLLADNGAEGVELAKDQEVLLHLRPDEGLRAPGGEPADDTLLIRNPLLYPLGKQYRFIRSEQDDQGKYQFVLDSVTADPFYKSLFKWLDKGPVRFGELHKWVMGRGACSREDATSYISFLMQQQMVYSRDRGGIIGDDLIPKADPSFWQDRKGWSVNAGESDVAALVSTGYAAGPYFYAAAERPSFKGGIAAEDRDELERAVRILQRLSTPAMIPGLQQFTADFKARFDRQKVPLLLALDPDSGIAYEGLAEAGGGNEVLKDLLFPPPEAGPVSLEWTAIHRYLLSVWKNASDPYAAVELTEAELYEAGIGESHALFPNTTGILFCQSGDQLLIDSAGGANGAALIARFGVFSEEVAGLAREMAALECAANPDVAFADIGHFSHAHADNINRRRPVYPYEIPLDVFSVLPDDRQLPPGDLLLSLQQGELVLESRKLGKRVVPRLASAYNHQNSGLGIFRMLCDLQYQGTHAALAFNPGRWFPGMSFYPRFCTGRVVLSPARWTFGEKELALMTGDLRRFRERHRLPQWVSMGDTDQQLVFNLADKGEAAFFLDCARGLTRITLTEYLLPDRSVRAGYRPLAGQYTGILQHERPVYLPALAQENKRQKAVRREFAPGSDWLYLKVYCTALTSDIILQDVVRPLLKRSGDLVESWFFIRYTDPGYHLRLRFRIADGRDGAILLARFCRQLEQSGHDRLVYNLQGDTYQREMERYGAAYIDQAERVFWRGSELVLGYSGEEFRAGFSAALRMVGCLFEASRAADFASQMSERFLAEFRADKKMRVSLDLKFRELRPVLNAVAKEKASGTGMKMLLEELQRLALAAGGEAPVKREQLAADLVHMQVNRTFRNDQRKQELLVWYCLSKYLRSLKAQTERSVH
ncbi:lantibiotic dehydratase [Mucilaginibacter lutimaris]|uniref:Lantibiotic dehydratase n=1 Tax=Mucilaginibacter lutimaris TaxID=931629 RepID=A0ABW2ZLQ5_9SPHI